MSNHQYDLLTKVPGCPSKPSRNAKGCAFFPGTGPVGAVCGDCLHWEEKPNRAKKLLATKQGACRQRSRMVYQAEKTPPKVSAETFACKYFEDKLDD